MQLCNHCLHVPVSYLNEHHRKHTTSRNMDTLLQFYFSVGLIWAMFWSFKLTTIGLQKLAVRK